MDTCKLIYIDSKCPIYSSSIYIYIQDALSKFFFQLNNNNNSINCVIFLAKMVLLYKNIQE